MPSLRQSHLGPRLHERMHKQSGRLSYTTSLRSKAIVVRTALTHFPAVALRGEGYRYSCHIATATCSVCGGGRTNPPDARTVP